MAAFRPADPDFERRTRESFSRQGAMAFIGASLERIEAGRVEIPLQFKLNLMAAADGERARAVGQVIRSGRTLTVSQLDVYVEKVGRSTHCATGLQTLISLVGRTGVKD